MEAETSRLSKLAAELQDKLRTRSPLVDWTVDYSRDVGGSATPLYYGSDALYIHYSVRIGYRIFQGIFPTSRALIGSVYNEDDVLNEVVHTVINRIVYEAVRVR
jgi:1-acyl-sn-glycerol-3-phosphate acyltransferase